MDATTAPAPLDDARVGALEQRLVTALNEAAMTLMLSVGHRTALLDAMAEAGPLGTAALAEAAGLKERYVREWLGAMVAAGIVEHDHRAGTYVLPAEHAALLTRGGIANLAAMTQYIPLLGSAPPKKNSEAITASSSRNGKRIGE